MKNNKFIKGTIILLIGSLITKCLGMIIKIYHTRLLGPDGVSLLSLVNPTYSLILTLSVLGLPMALSTVIAKNKKGKKTLFSITPFIIIFDIIIIAIICTLSPFIAGTLLKNEIVTYPIIAMALTIPFVSLSSIIKGYFFGNQNMLPYAFSNVGEQILRLIIIIIVLPLLMKMGVVYAICGLFLINIFTELFSQLIFTFFMPKKISINIEDIKPDIEITKDVLRITVPTVSSRIVGNIFYFFEPVILNMTLMKVGYSASYILREYGIINGYSLSLLIFPTFFIQALSTSLIPEISKLFAKRDYRNVQKRLKQSLSFSLITGIIINTILFLFPSFFLNLLFGTDLGVNYVRFLAPFFILFYIEGPLMNVIQAMGNAKYTFKVTLYGCIIKLALMGGLSFLKIGLYGLIIAEIVNILFVVILDYIYLHKKIKAI